MFVSLAGPTSPAYSCGPGVLTQSNTSRRVPHRSFTTQAYVTGVLVRPGVRTRDSRHVYRSYVLTVTVSFLRRPTSPAYSAVLASGINQYPRADSLIVRFPRRSYESRVLVRRGVLTQSRASGPQSSTSDRVPHRFSSTQAYITGLLVRRGVVNQPRASDRVPDCSFSPQAYESRLQSIESRSAFPAPYTALRQLYRPFKVS